jgi:hypothetical protein
VRNLRCIKFRIAFAVCGLQLVAASHRLCHEMIEHGDPA